ncbi:MAG: beta-ketoacyl synthase [Bacteroidetes bacterium]|nr:beta-ketoacyl synthase [Bacteroidota bacterium]
MASEIMRPVYAIATNALSALGFTSDNHWAKIVQMQSGIGFHEDSSLSTSPFWGSQISPQAWQIIHEQTKTNQVLLPFEQMCVYSAQTALATLEVEIDFSETVFILSTTKGNIEWLGSIPDEQILPIASAAKISNVLGCHQNYHVVSHACISGVVACLYAQRLLESGRYKQAIVTGADRFSRFVLSGFQSFQAVANEVCRPFDAKRSGINLGEAASTIVFSTDDRFEPLARLVSGSTSNDANHISGPSRTGEELALSINRSLSTAKLDAADIDMISAHGTATLYNDEMEAKAFTLANLTHTPIHSLKGYVGHTLGAAGLIESTMIIEAIKHQQLIASLGYEQHGVSECLNITLQPEHKLLSTVLKTASGFGGCNATAIWQKC